MFRGTILSSSSVYLFIVGVAATYIQVSSTLCLANCTLGADQIPDCALSSNRCCSRNALSCPSYYTCLQGRMFSVVCPPSESYDPVTMRCRVGHVCYSQCLKKCSGLMGSSCSGDCCSPHPDNCKYFFTCTMNRVGLGQCPEGSGFDENSLACIPGFQCFLDEPDNYCKRMCRPNSQCTVDCCNPPSEPCSSVYSICQRGERTTKECPKSTRFNINNLTCDAETFNECTATNGLIEVSTTTVTTSITTSRGRRLLSKEEFLAAIYSIYTDVGQKFSKDIN